MSETGLPVGGSFGSSSRKMKSNGACFMACLVINGQRNIAYGSSVFYVLVRQVNDQPL